MGIIPTYMHPMGNHQRGWLLGGVAGVAAALAAICADISTKCAAAYEHGDCAVLLGVEWRKCAVYLSRSSLSEALGRALPPPLDGGEAFPADPRFSRLEGAFRTVLEEFEAVEARGWDEATPTRFGLAAPSEPFEAGTVTLSPVGGGGAFPRTYEMLREAMRDGAELVFAQFSVLRPGGAIPPHRGFERGRVTYHLPLRLEPGAAWLRAGGRTHRLVAGRGFAFDDYAEHEAANESPSRDRAVLWVQYRPAVY